MAVNNCYKMNVDHKKGILPTIPNDIIDYRKALTVKEKTVSLPSLPTATTKVTYRNFVLKQIVCNQHYETNVTFHYL